MPLLCLLALIDAASAESWPAGATVEQAALADITPEGFDAIAALIPALIPTSIAVDDQSGGYEGLWGQCYLGGYEYALSGADVSIAVAGASITPADGVLNITADLLVSVNSPSSPFSLFTSLECLDDTCYGYVDAFPVSVNMQMALDVVTGDAGQPVLDATIGTPQVSYTLDSSYIHLDDCAIGTVEEILNYVGISIYDLILGQLDGYLDEAVADMGPELEQTIEEAFSSASISEQMDVNGATVDLNLYPSDVVITPAGVRLQMSGSMNGSVATCVAAYDTGGSLRTDSAAPDLGAAPSGVPSPYHVGMALSDDFMNQALYALWRGGLLCYTVEPGGDIPLDTSLLNSMTGQAFEELFPESQPVALRTVPRAAPTAAFSTGNDVGVAISDLDLEFYAELDGRQARMLAITLDGTAGADLAFDGSTGQLAVELAVDADQFTPSIGWNEFVPEADDTILASFSGIFGTLLDTALGGLLGDMAAFSLPAFEGIGLTDLQTAATGNDGDWLGLYAWLGPVTYATGDGCGSDGGCSGGCVVGGTPVPGPAFWIVGAAFALRRRRSGRA